MDRTGTVREAHAVKEPQLERQGRKLAPLAWRFLGLGLLVLIPGIVLVLIGNSWSLPFGIALILIASLPSAVGIALLSSSSVARWAARHRLFA
jgi:hypothetical protein